MALVQINQGLYCDHWPFPPFRTACHWKEDEGVLAWCRSANSVLEKTQ